MSTSEISARPEDTVTHRVAILLTVTLVTMLYAMTVTIANVALPQMQGSLSATQDQIAWVVTFNIVATAIATPMTGWLTARFGRRRLMTYCIIGFSVASLLCGMANSVDELVIYRIAQGACGAPLVPLSQAIVVDTFPREQIGTATAIWGVGVILGPIIAPTLGGYLSETYNWRWVFFMILPVAAVALLLVLAFISDKRAGQRERLDWTGFLALAVTIAALQLMLDRGERNDWFESTETIIEAGLVIAGLYVFITHSLTAEKPFLPPSILRDRNFVIGICIALLFGMLNFTPLVLFPALLQNLRGYPDSIIGLLQAARGLGTFTGFLVMVFLANRIDPRVPLTLGFACQAVAGWYMAQFDINMTTWDVAWTSCLQGLGVGLIWVPLSVITFGSLDPKYVSDGTAMFHLLRNIGSSIHISISITLIIRMGKTNYADMTQYLSPYNENLNLPWVAGGWNLDSDAAIAAMSKELMRQATMIGYIDAFYLFTVTAAVAVPLVLLAKRKG